METFCIKPAGRGSGGEIKVKEFYRSVNKDQTILSIFHGFGHDLMKQLRDGGLSCLLHG